MGGTLPPVKSVTRLRRVVDRDLIKATELFAELDDDALDRVLAAAKTLELRRGDVLFEEGAEPDHLYVVEDGRVALASKSDDGRESVFALMERGDLFGEMPLLDGLGRSAEARALEPSTVVEIPYAPVRAAFEERPELLWGVVRAAVRCGSATWTPPSPTPCSSTSPAAPPSACSTWPTARTSSSSRSPRRSWPAWSARPASG